MLEVWIDGKKVEASDIRVNYKNKGGERTEIKLHAEGEDAWMTFKQVDSLGHTTSEMESWNDQGFMKRNVTLSAKHAPSKSVKSPTKDDVLAWYKEAKEEGIARFLWCHHVEEDYDTPLSVPARPPLDQVVIRLKKRGFEIIKLFDVSLPFEGQYNAVEE